MKNKQTARKMSIDAEKLNDILGFVHTQHQQQKDEMERMNHNYKEAVKQIATLEKEQNELIDKNTKLTNRWRFYDKKSIELSGENEKLKKEIKELKHNLSGVDDYSRDLLSQLTKLNPLKEENEKLQKIIDSRESSWVTNKRLLKEIKELKHNKSGWQHYSRDLLSQLTKQKEEYEVEMVCYQTLIDDISDHPDWQELIDDHEMEIDRVRQDREYENYKYFVNEYGKAGDRWDEFKIWLDENDMKLNDNDEIVDKEQ